MKPWSAEQLAELRRHSRLMAACWDLRVLAARMGRPSVEVNLALDALLGRTAEEAAAELATRFPAPRGLAGVVRRLFG